MISMGLVGKSGSVASGLDATSAAGFAAGAKELAALGDDAGDAAAEAVAEEAAGLAVAAESVFACAAVGVGAAGEQAVTSNAAQSRAGVSPARSATTKLTTMDLQIGECEQRPMLRGGPKARYKVGSVSRAEFFRLPPFSLLLVLSAFGFQPGLTAANTAAVKRKGRPFGRPICPQKV